MKYTNKITHSGAVVNVKSTALEYYPKCSVPLGVNVKSVTKPIIKININQWFNKHFTSNGHLN